MPEQTYGLGFMDTRGWLGHNAGVPGFSTTLFYYPELDVVVEVNGDFFSGDYCPPNLPTVTDGTHSYPCEAPDSRINAALA